MQTVSHFVVGKEKYDPEVIILYDEKDNEEERKIITDIT